MYEDWSAGRITEYNFNMLSEKYQTEQQELDTKIQQLRASMEADQQSMQDAEKWVELIRRYTNITELSADLRALAAYMDGGKWRADYEVDEAGLIPRCMKRGVLSQDGLYNFITDWEARK